MCNWSPLILSFIPSLKSPQKQGFYFEISSIPASFISTCHWHIVYKYKGKYVQTNLMR